MSDENLHKMDKVDTKVDDYNSKITEKVKIIEEKPTKRYEAVAKKFILAVVKVVTKSKLKKLYSIWRFC